MILVAIAAGLSLNLLIQFGLGAQELGTKKPLPLVQICIIFVNILVLWTLFNYIIVPFFSIFFAYMLFFPLCVLCCLGMENLATLICANLSEEQQAKFQEMKVFNALSAYNGLVLMALVLTIHMAGTFFEAFAVALCFSLGTLVAILMLNAIHQRSVSEAVPAFLRGRPLLLISMGFLSFIFGITAMLLFGVLVPQ